MIVYIVFVTLLSIVVAISGSTAGPSITQGIVYDKTFVPAHIMPAGKTVIFISDEWSVFIRDCATQPCKTAVYHVSRETYESTQIGQAMSFSQPSSVGELFGRGLFLVLALICLGLGALCLELLLTSDEFFILEFLGTLLMIFCVLLGEGCIYLTFRGLSGVI